MKKERRKTLFYLEKRWPKLGLILLALAFLPASEMVLITNTMAQQEIAPANAGEDDSIPSPPPGAANSSTLMDAVTKLKGGKSWDSNISTGKNFDNGGAIIEESREKIEREREERERDFIQK